MMALWNWIVENYVNVFMILAGLVAVAEAIARLTPTTVDDGIVERIGKAIHWLMDLFKIPNVKIENGKLGKHEKRD